MMYEQQKQRVIELLQELPLRRHYENGAWVYYLTNDKRFLWTELVNYMIDKLYRKEVGRMGIFGSNKGKGRGFASMDKAKQREIASKGGKASHAKGTAHKWDSEEARRAGQKGGRARQAKSL